MKRYFVQVVWSPEGTSGCTYTEKYRVDSLTAAAEFKKFVLVYGTVSDSRISEVVGAKNIKSVTVMEVDTHPYEGEE